MPPVRPSTMWRPASSAADDDTGEFTGRAIIGEPPGRASDEGLATPLRPTGRRDERIEEHLGFSAFPVEVADDDVHRHAVATDEHGARKDARRPGDGRV